MFWYSGILVNSCLCDFMLVHLNACADMGLYDFTRMTLWDCMTVHIKMFDYASVCDYRFICQNACANLRLYDCIRITLCLTVWLSSSWIDWLCDWCVCRCVSVKICFKYIHVRMFECKIVRLYVYVNICLSHCMHVRMCNWKVYDARMYDCVTMSLTEWLISNWTCYDNLTVCETMHVL